MEKICKLFNKKKHIDELMHWSSEMRNFPSISSLSNFSYFQNNLIKMHVAYIAQNDIKNFKLSDFQKVRGIYNKFVILLLLILPKKLLKIL